TSFWFSPNITFTPAPVSIRSVVDLRDYTFARREREWEVGEAIGRIRAWAGGSEKADIDWNKYRMAFLWCDTENAQEFNSYRFPVVDIIDGNPHYIWRAVTDAADRLEQSDISDDDKAEIERNLCALYERAVDQFDADDIECPFTDDGDDELEENNTNMDEILALREQYESA